MTDEFDELGLAPPPPDLSSLPDPPKVCAAPGCTNLVPPGAHALRRYCDDHFTPTGKGKAKKPRRDRPPASVNINLGSPKIARKDAELEIVEARVKQLVSTIGGLLVFSGNPLDAADVLNGKDEFARAVRELAQYEPWLKKLATGGGTPDRILAWVAVGMALLGILIPILDRHGQLPAQLRPLVTEMMNAENLHPTQVVIGDDEPRGAHAAA